MKIDEQWSWRAGYLFPKQGNMNARITKDTVSKAIVRARRDFKPSRPDVKPEEIRSHSSRHRWIIDAKNNNIPKEVAMMYTLISNTGTYDKVYGKPTMEQVSEIIKKSGMHKKMPRAH